MTLRLFIIIGCLLLPGLCGVALAEGPAEIRKQEGLFLFEDFQHWVTAGYIFTDSELRQATGKNVNVSHNFVESYNISLEAALLDPHIFESFLQGGILYNQNKNRIDSTSSSGSDVGYQYSFIGS